MIPSNLDEWSYVLIRKLVEDGVFETNKFDLKKDIPFKDDKSGKERLEKSVCAFANTEGGFLVFGIDDEKSLTSSERIIGIAPTKDFPREFGDKVINIEPHIDYDFKNPPIKIPDSKNVIHIVKIPQSPERPHMTNKKEFYYRTNRGNVPMVYQQIKDSFLNEEQRRQKLRLLFIELLSNKDRAKSMIEVVEDIERHYSLLTLDSTILQTLVVDTYPILIREKELIKLLIEIRSEIEVINNEQRILFNQMSFPDRIFQLGIGKLTKEHNENIRENIQGLIPLLDRSLEILKERYGLTNPLE